MVPRPVKAVILVFPYAEALPRLKAENERFANEASPKVDGSVFWMKQTVCAPVQRLADGVVDECECDI